MSEVVMRDGSNWRGQGGPQVEISPDLIELLEQSRREDGVLEVAATQDDEEVQELIKQSRIYARRQNLSFTSQFAQNENGSSILRFRLRDKRSYQKKAAQ